MPRDVSSPHLDLFKTVGVALDEYEQLWKLHASGIDIYERTHRLAVDALADLEEQVQALTGRNQFLSTEQVRADIAEARVRELEEQLQTLQAAVDEDWEWKGEYWKLIEQLETYE